MRTDIDTADLERQVWISLDMVDDPELDEPITDMGFVERVAVIDGQRVEVDFRLPTYWCSPNFAFLMAFGIRRELEKLAWAKEIDVHLGDHCFGDEVNEGVNSGRAFSKVFAQYCDGADLEAVTETFLAKAFDRRQEAMLVGLTKRDLSAQDIVAMRLDALEAFAFDGEEERKQKPRYLSLLRSRGLVRDPQDPVFVTWEGAPLTVASLPEHLDRLRGTRINMEFNGAMCRGLASTRYKEVEFGPDGPSLVDFIAGRVPVRNDATLRR